MIVGWNISKYVVVRQRLPSLERERAWVAFERLGLARSQAARGKLSNADHLQDDRAERAQPKRDAGSRLDAETQAAFCGRTRITDQIENAADNPDQTEYGRACVADIDREQPERGQKNRH